MTEAEKLKKLLTNVTEAIKTLDSELLAFQMTLEGFKTLHPWHGDLFEKSVETAKTSERYQQILHERYDKALERSLGKVRDEESMIEALKAFEVNRTKPIN